MNWLNIYGDNKSLSTALDALDIGETVKADLEDAKRIRVSIANTFSLTGRGKFLTKTGEDEEGERVLLITRLEAGEAKNKRHPKVKTFIDEDSLGVLKISEGIAYLDVLPLTGHTFVPLTPSDKLIKDCEKFCSYYNLTLKY